MVADLFEDISVDIALSVCHYQQTKGTGARLKALKNVLSLVRELVDPRELQAIHKENMMELVTIRTLISMDVFKHIPKQESISSHELARVVGVEESLLTRLLRMAVSAGILEQNSDKTFAHTKFSRAYAAEVGPRVAFQVFYDESFQPLTRLHQYLKENDFKEPEDQKTCPVMWNLGKEGESYWDVMRADPERSEAFAKGMRVSQKYLSSTGGPYDFGALARNAGERQVLVDVGGGHGQTICEILKNHPKVPAKQVVLQDLPKVVEAARQSNILPKDVQIQAYDYSDPQPIKGKNILCSRTVEESLTLK